MSHWIAHFLPVCTHDVIHTSIYKYLEYITYIVYMYRNIYQNNTVCQHLRMMSYTHSNKCTHIHKYVHVDRTLSASTQNKYIQRIVYIYRQLYLKNTVCQHLRMMLYTHSNICTHIHRYVYVNRTLSASSHNKYIQYIVYTYIENYMKTTPFASTCARCHTCIDVTHLDIYTMHTYNILYYILLTHVCIIYDT